MTCQSVWNSLLGACELMNIFVCREDSYINYVENIVIQNFSRPDDRALEVCVPLVYCNRVQTWYAICYCIYNKRMICIMIVR
jgi:hypothetical protein